MLCNSRGFVPSKSGDASTSVPLEIQVEMLSPMDSLKETVTEELGDSGNYGGGLVLIPDYNAGFSVLNASNYTLRGSVANLVLDYVTEVILPALEAQAAAEVARNFVGTYVSTDSNLNLV